MKDWKETLSAIYFALSLVSLCAVEGLPMWGLLLVVLNFAISGRLVAKYMR